MSDRYSTKGNSEGEFQPGSNGKILLNKPGLVDPHEMDNLEFDRLSELQDQLFTEIQCDSKIDISNLREWHKRWLGNIYEWAGNYRSVNLTKDGFLFAAAHLIPDLMSNFNDKYLWIYTPCEGKSDTELVEALSICHIELIIIHPFRDGNGRLARLLATVMALQADIPPLDFYPMESDKQRYISAIHAGHAGDDKPMKQLFGEVLNYTKQQASRNEYPGNE